MPKRNFCFFFFQLVKKLSDLTGCTQVVDVGSGQVSQTPGKARLAGRMPMEASAEKWEVRGRGWILSL